MTALELAIVIVIGVTALVLIVIVIASFLYAFFYKKPLLTPGLLPALRFGGIGALVGLLGLVVFILLGYFL